MTVKIWKYVYIIATVVGSLLGRMASIETSAEPTTITIGDRIVYTVIITHDEGVDIAWPGAGAELGQFQIIDYELPQPVTLEDGRVQEKIIYYISTYDTGEWTIPPTAIAYVDETDSTRLLRTEPINITVESILSDKDCAKIKAITESDTTLAGMEQQIAAGRALQMAKEELLHDVNPVYRLKRGWKFWVGIGVVVIALAGLFTGFILWQKRRGKVGGIFSFSAPPVPPHEAALIELAALLASQHISRGEFKEYYTKLSDILRRYIEGRIGVQALELSTSETMENLAEADFPMTSEQTGLVEKALYRCDLVKFAKLIPPDDWHLDTVEIARRFIEETKPEEPKERESEETVNEAEPASISEEPETEPEQLPEVTQ